MASIRLSGTLEDPLEDSPQGNKIRFTHMTTTGETVEGFQSLVTFDSTGIYDFNLNYGNVFVETFDTLSQKWIEHGIITINADTPATSIPALLGITEPATDADLLVFQTLVADAELARDEAELARDEAASSAEEISSTKYEAVIKDSFGGRVNIDRIVNQKWSTRTINLLGDSISHGSFGEQLYWNGWTQLLRKMINAEYGLANYGFASAWSKTGDDTGDSWFREVHDVTTTGGGWSVKTNAGATNLISGLGFTGGIGSVMNVTAPFICSVFRVWYLKTELGGSFEVYLNDTLQGTIDTSTVAAEETAVATFNNASSDDGILNIKIVPITDNVTLMGLSYVNGTSDLCFNNFSQSSRQMRYLSEATIENTIKESTDFIFALGFNDNVGASSDPDHLADIQERADWIVEYAIQYNVKVYILDFIWSGDSTNNVRNLLRDMASRIPSATYIPFPDHFSIAGEEVTNEYRTDTINLFVDSAHPNVRGCQIIAETVAKAMNLSITSKAIANKSDNIWYPVDLSNSGLVSGFGNFENRTAWRISGNNLQLKGFVRMDDDSIIPAGTYPILDTFEYARIPATQEYPVEYRVASITTDNGQENIDVVSATIVVGIGFTGVDLVVKEGFDKFKIDWNITIPIQAY